jgi:RimJ/RimL family protein N-acetyltransferase
VRVATLPSEIRTERLVVRGWRDDDAEALGHAVAASVEHLRPWMPWAADEPLSLEARRELIARWQRAWADDGETVYGILHDGTIVGGTGLHRRRGPGVLEIGYWIGVDHIGRGYATEAARALTAAAFAVPGIAVVEIRHDRANTRSGRVPAKLGFVLEEEVPDAVTAPAEIGIDCVWRVHRDRWPAPDGPTRR